MGKHEAELEWLRFQRMDPQPKTGKPAAASTITRWLSCLSGLYEYAVVHAGLIKAARNVVLAPSRGLMEGQMPDSGHYDILIMGSGEAGKWLAWTMGGTGSSHRRR